MVIESLSLRDFRNIEAAEITLSGGLCALCGANAMGKTNILESLYLYSAGRSFRAGRDRELIRFGAENAETKITFLEDGREKNARMRIFGDRRKEVQVGGVPIEKMGQLIGAFPMILFAPEHLDIVKDGPSGRRRFLDLAISQLSPTYYSNVATLGKIIAHKNALLRHERASGRAGGTLEIWNARFANTAAAVIKKRAEYIEKLNAAAALKLLLLSGGKEELTLSYVGFAQGAECDSEARLFKKLCEKEGAERQAGSCLIGPQRDDMEILIGGKAARLFASQGQCRSVVLALKLAEGELLKEQRGQAPIYLLDDVMSELDPARKKFLESAAEASQVLLTTCDAVEGADKIYRVENGRITAEK